MSQMQIVDICAHRGASGSFPENTAEAFHGARSEGADWVELDVRLNRWGSLIVHHDSVYRDGRGVWATRAEELPAGVIELNEALDACEGMGVNIEIKNSPGDLGDVAEPGDRAVPHDLAVADAVVELVASRAKRATASGSTPMAVVVSSFDAPTLQRVRSLTPRLATAQLVFDLNADPTAPERAAEAGDTAINPWDPFVDEDFMDRCVSLGLGVNPWTVDDPDRIRQLGRLGVTSIITNYPRAARSALVADD